MMNMISKHDHVPHHVRPVRPDEHDDDDDGLVVF